MFLSIIYLIISPVHPALWLHTHVPTSFTKRSCKNYFYKSHIWWRRGFQQLDCKVIPFHLFLDNKTVFHSGPRTEPPVGVTLQPLPCAFALSSLWAVPLQLNWPSRRFCVCAFSHTFTTLVFCVFVGIVMPLSLPLFTVFLQICIECCIFKAVLTHTQPIQGFCLQKVVQQEQGAVPMRQGPVCAHTDTLTWVGPAAEQPLKVTGGCRSPWCWSAKQSLAH